MKYQVCVFLVLLCDILGSTSSHRGHRCVHDQIFKDHRHVKPIESSQQATDRLLAVNDGWHGIRIEVNYREANGLVDANPGLSSRYEISIRQLESVKNYFQSYLQVNAPPLLVFQGGSCYKTEVAAFAKDIDLYITIYPMNDQNADFFAAATACYSSDRDNRPVIGAYILNLAFITNNVLYDFIYFSTFAHEFTHILGFSNNLYKYFVEPGTTRRRNLAEVVGTYSVGSELFQFIVLPEVAAYAKTFFNCQSLPGLPLENDGGSGSAGSHWEKLFLPVEYMNPTVENPGILSPFTFKLLEASGWYLVNYQAAQYYGWGQNSGCDHFEICPKTQGYCSGQTTGAYVCGENYISKSQCVISTTFTSNCPYIRPTLYNCLVADLFAKADYEDYGPGSRCVRYVHDGLSSALCHQVQCVDGGINIKVGNDQVFCNAADSLTTKDVGLNYRLECPDYNRFCNDFGQRCPNDCNAHGLCLQGKSCFCYTGWSGSACSESTSIDYFALTQGYGKSASGQQLWQAAGRLLAVVIAVIGFN